MCYGNDKALPSAGPRVFSVLVLCFYEVFIMSDFKVGTTISWLCIPTPIDGLNVSASLSVNSISRCSSSCLLLMLPFSSMWATQNPQLLRPLCSDSAVATVYSQHRSADYVCMGEKASHTRSPITHLLSAVKVKHQRLLLMVPRLHMPHRWNNGGQPRSNILEHSKKQLHKCIWPHLLVFNYQL